MVYVKKKKSLSHMQIVKALIRLHPHNLIRASIFCYNGAILPNYLSPTLPTRSSQFSLYIVGEQLVQVTQTY